MSYLSANNKDPKQPGNIYSGAAASAASAPGGQQQAVAAAGGLYRTAASATPGAAPLYQRQPGVAAPTPSYSYNSAASGQSAVPSSVAAAAAQQQAAMQYGQQQQQQYRQNGGVGSYGQAPRTAYNPQQQQHQMHHPMQQQQHGMSGGSNNGYQNARPYGGYHGGQYQQQQQHHHQMQGQQQQRGHGGSYSSNGGAGSGNRGGQAPRKNEGFKNKLFVGGISKETEKADFEEYFGKFGEITDCIVMKDPMTQISKGFGFVTFTTSDAIDKAMESRPHNINSKDVDVKRALPKESLRSGSGDVHPKKVFIGGLSKDVTDEQVRELASKFGTIEDVYISRKGDKNCYAFVTFEDQDSCDKMILCSFENSENNKPPLEINNRPVTVNKAVKKNRDDFNNQNSSMNSNYGGYSSAPYGQSSMLYAGAPYYPNNFGQK